MSLKLDGFEYRIYTNLYKNLDYWGWNRLKACLQAPIFYWASTCFLLRNSKFLLGIYLKFKEKLQVSVGL